MAVLVVGLLVLTVPRGAMGKPGRPVLSVSTHAASRHSAFEPMPKLKPAKDAMAKKHFWNRK
jgi:hypothetical protein